MMHPLHVAPPPADFSPETCGRVMDFVKTNDVSYAHLKAEAEKRVRQTRWSGAGKNMGVLGSYEPSRFHDTFVGNFRRAGVYKKIPVRTPVRYEYGLDEKDRLLAAFQYNTDPRLMKRLGKNYYESYFAGTDGDMTVYACYAAKDQEEKELSIVLGYRYDGGALAEAVKLTYLGEAMTNMDCDLFSYGADGALVSADTFYLISPALYASPIAKAIGYPGGLSIPMLSYRGVDYQIIHRRLSL